nr:tetratricopeptide repeat protein [uncultured Draconibacterium sp.]
MITTNTTTFQYFQSANTSFEEIKQNFVVRLKEFELLRSDLLDDEMKGSVQHFLILGRRGSGKSTLLRRIECEVNENELLNEKYITINFAEEQASIHRLFDLFEEIIKTLKCNFGYENLPDTDTLDIPDDYSEYSRDLYRHIQKALHGRSHKLLLLIDNIDKIFLGIKEDAQVLREILLNFDDIKVIGGSTLMSEHFWQYDLPFYQFFRVLRLEALSSDEIKNLMLSWSERLKVEALEKFVKTKPGQLEAIRILTDGMPRTLQFFVDLLINRPQQNGYAYIQKIMDLVTPLYQERLNNLPPIEQKIVLKLAFMWEAASIRDLVKPTKIQSKVLSANLKTLSDKRIVDKIATGKKNHLYRLTERFFNMWLIVTQGSPMEKRKARWLTIFLENFYDQKEIKQIVERHLDDLKSCKMKEDHLTLMTKALSQSKYTSFEERDMLIEQNLSIPTLDENLKSTLPSTSKEIIKRIHELVGNKNYVGAIREAINIPNECDGYKEMFLGNIYAEWNKYEKAFKNYLSSINKGNIIAYRYLALAYKNNERYNLAEEYFKKAINEGIETALFDLALLYEDQGDFNLAEEYYVKAIEKDNENAFNNLALLYEDQGKIDLAEEYYLKAVDKGVVGAFNNLAILYKNKEEQDLAEKYYLKAVDKGDVSAIFNLGLLYDDQGKVELAQKYYTQAIDCGNVRAFNNLGLLYENQGEIALAEEFFLRAIDEGNETASFNLAMMYQDQKKEGLAEEYYLKAIELGSVSAINNLAILYDTQKKNALAEEYFLEAIEKGNVNAINNLAFLYSNRGENELAEKYYLKAIEKGNSIALQNIFVLYYMVLKDKKKVETYINIGKKNSFLRNQHRILSQLYVGQVSGIRDEVFSLADEEDGLDEMFLTHLLVHFQKNLVWKLFNNEEFGQNLKNKFTPIYYVTSKLINDKETKLNLLKIPPEIEETVHEIMDNIEKLRKEYYPEA